MTTTPYDDTDDFKDRDNDLDIDSYIQDEDYAGYKMQGDGNYGEEERDMPLATSSSLTDSLAAAVWLPELNGRSAYCWPATHWQY